ncbi:MAG: 2-oxoacid ferredoxin oxidoreductase [Desulfuromonadales bacterium GWD2_61_12]|nr:MAG: 2-oxoacid ferredoxin oxidoreductase [Desulfuromonadales bacterium GWC2_61_20]OGR32744.1 MAG: 2-oxoacid ferredoxin oxidoreductase [Desulfuromonadales bacterium GWD2_61_12]HAD03162.1 2-oxoacid ferredoxin oxidoreductase [Desulfuromonas sp.]HBT83346.1 2-oxoacid ferredoxin oxidoreductase [Desulfuromonas sp.]
MSENRFARPGCDVAWCPGCGNYGILNQVRDTLAALDLDQQRTVLVSGIGQAAKLPQYLRVHYFNGLHGRALPVATAIKASNRNLTVIAESGDGDMYGEGGNHFLHCIRRNPDLTNIVHNNMVYGLTKGQASPTSPRGFVTPLQVDGVILEPFNPLAVAIALDAAFVARAYVGNVEETRAILQAAIQHRGYALVDLLQPCVTFNKLNTYQWFAAHTAPLPSDHDPGDRQQAFARACEEEPLRLGIFYQKEKPVFEEQLAAYAADPRPVHERRVDLGLLATTMRELGWG